MHILILLLYYNRPKLVQNALHSIQNSSYHDWTLFIHDDNSPQPILTNLPHTYHLNTDTKPQKLERGSSLGLVVNKVLKESPADIAIMLCDDDALHPLYLQNLNDYFTNNPEVNSCYSNVILYNPLIESYLDAINRPPDPEYYLNYQTNPISPYNIVDASQVAWRLSCNKQFNAWFPDYLDKNHDAAFYKELEKSGPTHPSGFISQFKGIHEQQLCHFTFEQALLK